jgi:fatty-acyl-CoA synthase
MASSKATVVASQQELCPTVSAYGLTEGWAGPCVSPLDATLGQRCEASGTPLPGYAFRIVDPMDEHVCAPGEFGEIQMRGYTVMKGYLHDDAATAAAFTADGWLRTGDMGALRADGHLHFTGRYKDILKVGGENVAPAEVEALLATHDAIASVAVIGRAHERLGEVPIAVVVPRAGRSLDAQEIAEFCRGRIASFKVPRDVVLIDALPMTSSGKVQKHVLRERFRSA